MPNNFRIVTPNTPYYVAKSGSDVNSGTSKDAPKATFGSAMQSIWGTSSALASLVIGAGTYEEALAITARANSGSNVIADGEVLLRGNTTNSLQLGRQTGTFLLNFNGFRFENYASFISGAHSFINCRFKDVQSAQFSYVVNPTYVQNCIFVNCPNVTFNNASGDATTMVVRNCIFINCAVTTGPNVTLKDCYFNSANPLNLSATGSDASNVNYNNIMGNIRIGNGAYQTLAAHQASNPGYNTNSFNAAPKFNSVAKLDFSLQADSPHIGAGSTGGNIGGTSFGRPSVFYLDPEWQSANGAIWDGIEVSGQDVVLSAGRTSGSITSAAIKLAANPVQLDVVNFSGLTIFNKSQPGGSATNMNVPDCNIYNNAAGLAGGTPDRLAYEMRFTDNDIQPGSAVDWINGYATPPGAWVAFELNQVPKIDSAGIGNGSGDYNVATGLPISVIYVQVRLTLTNGYV